MSLRSVLFAFPYSSVRSRLGGMVGPGLGILAAVLAPALVGVESSAGAWTNPVAPMLECDHVFAEADCIRAVGSNVRGGRGGGKTKVGGVNVTNVNNWCPLFTSACIHLYRETNGLPGFQGSAQEVRDYFTATEDPIPSPLPAADEVTGEHCGQVGTPSASISIGSFSSNNPGGKPATHWELRTKRDDGSEDLFGGTF